MHGQFKRLLKLIKDGFYKKMVAGSNLNSAACLHSRYGVLALMMAPHAEACGKCSRRTRGCVTWSSLDEYFRHMYTLNSEYPEYPL